MFDHSGIWGVMEQGGNNILWIQMWAWKLPFQMQFFFFVFFWRTTGCMHNSHFVLNFLHIIWTHPIHHILLSTPWITEVGVLFLCGLPLLCLLATLIVEEIIVEYKFLVIVFGWRSNHIWYHTTLEGMWPHYMI